MQADQILKQIEAASDALLTSKARAYLGPSSLGTCKRATWYKFRQAHVVRHGGRMLRLFNRGHLEEDRICRWLLAAGWGVRPTRERLVQDGRGWYFTVPWDQPFEGTDVSCVGAHRDAAAARGVRVGQWAFSRLGGHYKGHSDGRVCPPAEAIGGAPSWGLLEAKTHNAKSFARLRVKGVLSSKPEHVQQMQAYMHEFGLPWALYVAVCKDDDDIYVEVLPARPELGAALQDVAAAIIQANEPPVKYSPDPSWFVCKFCDFREICHYGKPPAKSCRTCVFSRADVDEGGWYCQHWHQKIPAGAVAAGCDLWEPHK